MVPEKTGFALIAAAPIRYRVFGRGRRAVFLIHGNGEDWRVFKNLIPALSEEYTVIAMDSRGHGDSGFGEGTMSLKRIALDAAEIMGKLRIKRPDVIGFSDGGNAALLLALRYPRLIGKLVVAGANLKAGGVKAYAQIPVEIGYRVCRGLGRFVSRAGKMSEILGLMVGQPNIAPWRLGKINADTLVLAGERDIIKYSHTRLIAGSIPRAKLKIIPGASHFIFGKWSALTNKAILDFLKEE